MSSSVSAKVRCGDTTAAGRACRAWAVRGSVPPQCSSHLGRNVGAGAPVGNQNRLVHGYYGRTLTDDEVADLVAFAMNDSVLDEVAAIRVSMQRVMKRLQSADVPDALFVVFVGLIFDGARSVAALLRSQRVLQGDAADSLTNALADILGEIGEEWGRPL